MYIILDTELTPDIREKYTVLPLEAVQVGEDQYVRAYCIVPAEKLPLGQLPNLDNAVRLHEEFVTAFEKGDYKLLEDLAKYLTGQFGGELDSFYENILERISKSE